MKIYCTVEEFANIVKGCHDARKVTGCDRCALYNVCCEMDGDVVQFVSKDTIISENGNVKTGDHDSFCIREHPECLCNTCKNDNSHSGGKPCCEKHNCGDCKMDQCPDYSKESK